MQNLDRKTFENDQLTRVKLDRLLHDILPASAVRSFEEDRCYLFHILFFNLFLSCSISLYSYYVSHIVLLLKYFVLFLGSFVILLQ